jgi:peptidyl-tRNA hydrolase
VPTLVIFRPCKLPIFLLIRPSNDQVLCLRSIYFMLSYLCLKSIENKLNVKYKKYLVNKKELLHKKGVSKFCSKGKLRSNKKTVLSIDKSCRQRSYIRIFKGHYLSLASKIIDKYIKKFFPKTNLTYRWAKGIINASLSDYASIWEQNIHTKIWCIIHSGNYILT